MAVRRGDARRSRERGKRKTTRNAQNRPANKYTCSAPSDHNWPKFDVQNRIFLFDFSLLMFVRCWRLHFNRLMETEREKKKKWWQVRSWGNDLTLCCVYLMVKGEERTVKWEKSCCLLMILERNKSCDRPLMLTLSRRFPNNLPHSISCPFILLRFSTETSNIFHCDGAIYWFSGRSVEAINQPNQPEIVDCSNFNWSGSERRDEKNAFRLFKMREGPFWNRSWAMPAE